MRNKGTLVNIDNSDLAVYPNGRIKNQTGVGDGTPVNEEVYGDIHETKDKLMRLYGISHNGLPDNETNGYQLIEALVALASKNDFCLPLNSVADVLTVPLKIGKLKDNEVFILKASINKNVETTIKGTLDNVTKAVTFLGDFKANEYVRMINTPGSVVIIRMVDSFNLESVITDLNFLKKASQAEENAGAVDTAATTPVVNKVAFTKRVIGSDSGGFLAKPTGDPDERNGLLSKADKKKIDDYADPASLIVVTSGTGVSTSNRGGGTANNNFNYNYVDVYPPAGKTMANLRGFICSIAEIDFAGDVDSNDLLWCKHQVNPGSIRIICNNNENGADSKVNYLGIWI